MDIACHTGGLSDLTLEGALGTAARLGFRFIDLAHIDAERAFQQPEVEAATVRALLNDFNLRLTDLCLPPLDRLNAPDPAERTAAFTQFEGLLAFAGALHTPGITISPGVVHEDGQEHSFARLVAALVQMKRAADAAVPGMRLSIEPQAGSAAELPDDALLLLDCVPGLRLTLDYAQFLYQGLSRKEITPLLSKAAHVHVRQAVKNRLQTGFELGRLDIRETVEDIRDSGYKGAVAVEYLNTPGEFGAVAVNVIEETVKTRDALRNARLAVLHV